MNVDLVRMVAQSLCAETSMVVRDAPSVLALEQLVTTTSGQWSWSREVEHLRDCLDTRTIAQNPTTGFDARWSADHGPFLHQ